MVQYMVIITSGVEWQLYQARLSPDRFKDFLQLRRELAPFGRPLAQLETAPLSSPSGHSDDKAQEEEQAGQDGPIAPAEITHGLFLAHD
jgi:hypothetical protein